MQVCYMCSQRPVLSSGPARLFHKPASDPQLVRSGQVKSEFLMCTFRASCCRARLSRAQVPPSPVPLSGTGKKRGRE